MYKRRCLDFESSMLTSFKGPPGETSSMLEVGYSMKDDEDERFVNLQTKYSDTDVEPSYKIFLEHLRKDSKSYILEMIGGDQYLPVCLKYEAENEPSYKIQLETVGRMDFETERMWQNGTSSPKSNQIHGPSDSGNLLKTGCSLVDDSFQAFLSHVRLQDGLMILEWEHGVSIKYEKVNRMPTIPDDLATESTLTSAEQSLIPYQSSPQHSESLVYEEASSTIVARRCSNSFEFATELMAVLDKPYDNNEYNELLKQATDRKPVSKLKHLRKMSIFYATEKEGLSYLDHYPDLAEKIDSADCHRGLTLLRGFFFWLEHLCHDGAFMPWLWLPSSHDTFMDDCELLLPLNTAPYEI